MSVTTTSSKRLYEGMFLFDANLAAKDWPGLEQHVRDLLKRNEAELEYSERWPDRKLAYEIKGCKKGTYLLTYFKAPPQAIPRFQRDCQLSERILRVLVVYDETLVKDCQKRINREIQGSPEEIEERRERTKLARESRVSPSTEQQPLAEPKSKEPVREGDTEEITEGRLEVEVKDSDAE